MIGWEAGKNSGRGKGQTHLKTLQKLTSWDDGSADLMWT